MVEITTWLVGSIPPKEQKIVQDCVAKNSCHTEKLEIPYRRELGEGGACVAPSGAWSSSKEF